MESPVVGPVTMWILFVMTFVLPAVVILIDNGTLSRK